MSLFTYDGPEGHTWLDISAVPKAGEVWDWGEIDPGETFWTPAPDDAEVTRRVHPTDVDYAAPNESLEDLTKKQLVALGAGEGLALKESTAKADLVAAIETHRLTQTAPPDDYSTPDPDADNTDPATDADTPKE